MHHLKLERVLDIKSAKIAEALAKIRRPSYFISLLSSYLPAYLSDLSIFASGGVVLDRLFERGLEWVFKDEQLVERPRTMKISEIRTAFATALNATREEGLERGFNITKVAIAVPEWFDLEGLLEQAVWSVGMETEMARRALRRTTAGAIGAGIGGGERVLAVGLNEWFLEMASFQTEGMRVDGEGIREAAVPVMRLGSMSLEGAIVEVLVERGGVELLRSERNQVVREVKRVRVVNGFLDGVVRRMEEREAGVGTGRRKVKSGDLVVRKGDDDVTEWPISVAFEGGGRFEALILKEDVTKAEDEYVEKLTEQLKSFLEALTRKYIPHVTMLSNKVQW